jgi:hypothetical protein
MPETITLEENVAAPVTPRDELRVAAPVTPRVELRVVTPVTPSVVPTVAAPVVLNDAEASVELNTPAPDTVSADRVPTEVRPELRIPAPRVVALSTEFPPT